MIGSWRPGHPALGIILAGLFAGPALGAEGTLPAVPQPSALAGQLAGLFVVSTVLESGLTTLFQWRVYREFLNGRAVKSIVMVLAGYMVASAFHYDIFASIMNLFQPTAESNELSRWLSAFILAGGSTAINELLRKLGFRPPLAASEPVAQPNQDEAWISVRIVPRTVVGQVAVNIARLDPQKPAGSLPVMAGLVGQRGFLERLLGLFRADPMRLPSYGGRTLVSGVAYRISVSGKRTDNEKTAAFDELIFEGCFAERAVVDFVKTI